MIFPEGGLLQATGWTRTRPRAIQKLALHVYSVQATYSNQRYMYKHKASVCTSHGLLLKEPVGICFDIDSLLSLVSSCYGIDQNEPQSCSRLKAA